MKILVSGVRDGQIYRLADVRKLPMVLRDEEAKSAFLEGGPRSIEEAIKLCERKRDEKREQFPDEITLPNASIFQLAEMLTQGIKELPFSEYRSLQARKYEEANEQIRIFEDLAEQLRELLTDVTK